MIEQAKRALSVARGAAPDDAFRLLRRQARNERRDIHVVGAEVVPNYGRFAPSENGRVTAPSTAS